jgi:hypothetical protein
VQGSSWQPHSERQTTAPSKGEARPPSDQSESSEAGRSAGEQPTETVQTPAESTPHQADSTESASERLAATYKAIKAAEELKPVSPDLLKQAFESLTTSG